LQKHHQTVGKNMLALHGQLPTPSVKLSRHLSHIPQHIGIDRLCPRGPQELIWVSKSSAAKVNVSKVQYLIQKAYFGGKKTNKKS